MKHIIQKSSQYWRKLSEKRLYPTHSIMPQVFMVEKTVHLKMRHNYIGSITAMNLCYGIKRFCSYGATLNHEKREIVFPDDDCLENFYDDDNCMDFDEQPKTVQDMSLHDIQIIDDPLQWLNLVKSSELENTMENMTL